MLLGIVIAGGAALAAALAYVFVSAVGFDGRIDRLRQLMIAGQRLAQPARVELPEIVRTYALRAGGRQGGPAVFHAEHRASLASAKGQPPMAITAEQWTGTRSAGIVWKAKGAMMGLPVRVIDSYVEGAGLLEARLLGAIQVAGASGPAGDKGELLRYLSELPIYPDAILNAGGLSWRQLDANTVEVSARTHDDTAAIRFLFDAAGDIVGMQADDRPMIAGNTIMPTPWHGFYSDYRQFGAYRIPAHGEVGWVLADGLFIYWKGDVVSLGPAQ